MHHLVEAKVMGLLEPRLRAMMFPAGGWLYEDAHYLVCDVDLDPDAARAFVPAPLRLDERAHASVFLAWFPKNTFGSVYREAGVFFHVRHGRTRAVFSPWMIVDDDVALITGRELLGYPKKLGEISFTLDGDRVSSAAARRGEPLLSMEGTLGDRIVDAPPIIGQTHRNVRASMGLAMPKIIAFEPREEQIDVRHAELRLRVGSSERDPLGDMGLGEVRAARLHRVNIAGSKLPIPIRGVSPMWFMRQWLLRAH
jgi:acetoacetate decarboxylase